MIKIINFTMFSLSSLIIFPRFLALLGSPPNSKFTHTVYADFLIYTGYLQRVKRYKRDFATSGWSLRPNHSTLLSIILIQGNLLHQQ